MINILIVEDESIVALEISNFVKTLGFNPIATVSNGKKAMEIIRSNVVDLILMDVYIKGDIDGISVAQQINQIKNIPIIYISAFSDDITLQRAIETNPSTYLIKPFHEKELEVAIKIALKQVQKEFGSYRKGDITFDQEFSYDSQADELLFIGEVVHLTKQERQLLHLLLNCKNQIVSIYDVENEIWPTKESNENTRRALVSRLRSKLNYKFIQTIHSIGYKINF
ncbi:response regulator [Sulfurimonas sp.]|uniref:response regulator n=1 Tax=Sulfurimonas sp. TaxID=2022749 RepID=UPI003D107E35